MLLGFSVKAEDTAISLLNRDLKPSMKSIEKPIRLYTYFNINGGLNSLNTLNKRQDLLNRFFAATMMNFWNVEATGVKGINAGLGLYTAIDPHTSKSFGNVAAEIEIAKGTSYLDVYNPIVLGSDTINQLIKENLIFKNEINAIFIMHKGRYAFSRDTLRAMVRPEYKNFRKLVQRIFIQSNLVMIEYNWQSSLPGFCRMNRASAFVLVGRVTTNTQGAARLIDNFSKILITEEELPNRSAAESSAVARVLKFKNMLNEMIFKPTYVQKLKVVNAHYAHAEEKNEIFNKTYSCER